MADRKTGWSAVRRDAVGFGSAGPAGLAGQPVVIVGQRLDQAVRDQPVEAARTLKSVAQSGIWYLVGERRAVDRSR